MKSKTGELRLDHRGQSAVIALGIYYLESHLNFPNTPFPHKDKILPYFFDLMKNLPLARWTDSQLLFHNRCLPTAECFSFSLTTLLCDIAVFDAEARNDILDFQVAFLAKISQLILSKKQDTESPVNGLLSKRIVPLLFGHARAMGRFSSESLFLKLFPKPTPPILVKAESPSTKNRSFSNFRSIIPQSLSTTVFANIESFHIKPKDEGSLIYFRGFGSSFEVTNESIQFSVTHLETILKVAQSTLLDKPVLKYLDGLASEMFATQSGKYPYRSFSETLNLVLVTVLKQILSGHSELPLTFMIDIQELVRSLFTSGQTELQSRNFDHHHKQLLMETKTTSNTLSTAAR